MSTSKSSKTSSNKSDDAVSSLFKEISVTKRINEEGIKFIFTKIFSSI